MCGLVAVVQDVWKNNTSSNMPDIHENTARIRHRGPDGMHVNHYKNFRLGHTRLAIVDPNSAAADQPFDLTFEKSKYHVVANGEIYNHESLYQQLQKEGWSHERISHSDCEIIGHAYARYGVDCVKYLDGMFAFCVLQEDANGNLVHAMAARDPVGIKPLYYGQTLAGAFVFASELKALTGLALPETVVAIPPGHYWTPESGLVCYYNPDWLRKVNIQIDSEDRIGSYK